MLETVRAKNHIKCTEGVGPTFRRAFAPPRAGSTFTAPPPAHPLGVRSKGREGLKTPNIHQEEPPQTTSLVPLVPRPRQPMTKTIITHDEIE